MSQSAIRYSVWPPVAAVVGAGIVHAIAAAHLTIVDPITALLGEHQGALVALIAARLFLMFVAPALAVHVVARAVARPRSTG